MVARVKKEVEIHSRLKHPSILEVGSIPGTRMCRVKAKINCVFLVPQLTLVLSPDPKHFFVNFDPDFVLNQPN